VVLTVWCSLCGAHCVVLTVWCSLCGAHCVVLTVWCSLCGARVVLRRYAEDKEKEGGIIRRQVVEILTPALDRGLTRDEGAVFLLAIAEEKPRPRRERAGAAGGAAVAADGDCTLGVVLVDAAAGEVIIGSFRDGPARDTLGALLALVEPREVVVSRTRPQGALSNATRTALQRHARGSGAGGCQLCTLRTVERGMTPLPAFSPADTLSAVAHFGGISPRCGTGSSGEEEDSLPRALAEASEVAMEALAYAVRHGTGGSASSKHNAPRVENPAEVTPTPRWKPEPCGALLVPLPLYNCSSCGLTKVSSLCVVHGPYAAWLGRAQRSLSYARAASGVSSSGVGAMAEEGRMVSTVERVASMDRRRRAHYRRGPLPKQWRERRWRRLMRGKRTPTSTPESRLRRSTLRTRDRLSASTRPPSSPCTYSMGGAPTAPRPVPALAPLPHAHPRRRSCTPRGPFSGSWTPPFPAPAAAACVSGCYSRCGV